MYTHIDTIHAYTVFIQQPPRNTWQTDLGEVRPVWLEVQLLLELFRVTFPTATPTSEFLTQLSTPLTPFQDSSEGTHPEQAAVLFTTVTRPACQPQLRSQLPSKYRWPVSKAEVEV